MRTDYRIDDYQETYFVIDNFEALRRATEPDFTPIYDRLEGQPDIAPGAVISGDTVLYRGTGAYHMRKAKAAG